MPRTLATGLGLLFVLLFLASVFGVYHDSVWLAQQGKLGFLPYGYSELLINYSGGFIRRGLFGALLEHAAHGGSALLVASKYLFTQYVVFAVAFVVLAFRKLRSAWLVLLATLAPGGILVMGLLGEYWYRKEIFFFALLAVSAILKLLISRVADRAIRSRLAEALILLVVIESIVGSMVHDGYTFLAAPANALLLQSIWRLRGDRAEATVNKVAYLYLGLQLALFVILGLGFGTNARIADQIWTHLAPADQAFFPGKDHEAITVLTLGLRGLVGNLPRILNQGLLWWYFGPWLCLFSYYAVVISLAPGGPKAQEGWLRVYLTLVLCMVPMYLMGYDYGRWTADIHIAFLLVWMSSDPGELTHLGLLPAALFQRASTWSGNVGQHLRQAAQHVLSAARTHIVVAVLIMLVFDAFSYLPEVAPGKRWTSLGKQLALVAHYAVQVAHHRK